MPDPQNLVLVIPDSLRADFWPDWPGTTFDVVTAGTESPTCIPTLLSGQPPNAHGIKWFHDRPTQVPTVFDLESEGYDVGYWDNPEDLIRHVLRAPPHRSLADMETPFVWVCRLMWTHHPYGVQWSDLDDPSCVVKPEPASIREFPGASEEWETGRDYMELMRAGEIDYLADYEHAVERVEERVAAIEATLRDLELYDDTFVIITADHGEAWGATGYDDCPHFVHTFQPCNHIVNVRGTVLDRDLSVDEPVRQQDILGLWDESWLGNRDDIAVIEREVDITPGDAKQRLADLGYL